MQRITARHQIAAWQRAASAPDEVLRRPPQADFLK
jgi:hypothetical protein